jgi:hypothetical protein
MAPKTTPKNPNKAPAIPVRLLHFMLKDNQELAYGLWIGI